MISWVRESVFGEGLPVIVVPVKNFDPVVTMTTF